MPAKVARQASTQHASRQPWPAARLTSQRAACHPVALAAQEPGEEGQEGDDAALRSFETWEPPKASAGVGTAPPPAANSADVVAMLISIYGSKELFINEYRWPPPGCQAHM